MNNAGSRVGWVSAALTVAWLAGCGGAIVRGTTGTGGSGASTGASTGGGSTGASCPNACAPSATQCVGTQVQTCTARLPGCPVWTAPGGCPAGQQCSGSACVQVSTGTTGGSCANFCPAEGATRCAGSQLETCSKASTTCLQWGPATSCPSGQACDPTQNACSAGTGTGGTTGSACNPQCASAGATQCTGVDVEICHAVSGCLIWSGPQTCPAGQVCGGGNNVCVQQDAGSSATSGTTTTSGGTTGSSCTDQCALGGTLCSGVQVQTCDFGVDGCLEWQAAVACSAGQLCDPTLNACVGICQASDVQSACASAANVINGCCAGGFSLSGDQLCAQELTAGNDPGSQCTSLAGDACSTIESLYRQVGTCCCPTGLFCDEETSAFTCVPQCTSATSCASQATRTACAPNDNQGALVQGPNICKADDALPYHGCVGITETCGSGFDCWAVGSIEKVCTTSCASSTDCGNRGVVCCDLTATCDNNVASCAAAGACLPCGSY